MPIAVRKIETKPSGPPDEYDIRENVTTRTAANPIADIAHNESGGGVPGFLRKLWRRRLTVLGTTGLLTGLIVLGLSFITSRYTASALVMIDARKAQVVNVEAVLSSLSPDAETIQSEIQVIKSRALIERVIDRLKLEQDPEFNRDSPQSWTQQINFRRYLPMEWWTLLAGTAETPSSALPATDAREAVVTNFLSNLHVVPVSRSRVVKISYDSHDPRKAAEIVNTLADLYTVAQLDAKFAATKRANQWLNERLVDLRSQVEAAESAVEAYRRDAGLVRGKDSALISQEVSETSTQLLAARSKRADVEARLRNVGRILTKEGGRGSESLAEVLQSPLIQRLREQEAMTGAKLADMSGRFGDRHPTIVNAQMELSEIRAKIAVEIKKVIQSLQNDARVEKGREEALMVNLDKLRAEAGRISEAGIRLHTLEREADASRALLQTFLSRSKETSNQADLQEPDAQVISRASVPTEPSFPKRALVILIGAFGALAAGVLLALLLEQFDAGFRSMDQIEPLTGIKGLGLMPALKRRVAAKPDDMLIQQPFSPFSEAVRGVHTSLFLTEESCRPKSVLICSSLPGEGKTTLVASLAKLVAASGCRVVVIDCDLRRSGLQDVFAVKRCPGLTEYLTGRAHLSEIVQSNQLSCVDAIASGSTVPHAPSLLASPQMAECLHTLSLQYDVILIDSAPIVAVSDALALAYQVDRSVFLVRWGKTRREIAVRAARQLALAGADLGGVVLTMVHTGKHAAYRYGDSAYCARSLRKYYKQCQ